MGKRLFVNADARGGEVRVEILDARGRNRLEPHSLEDSIPVTGDQLHAELRWKGTQDLSSLSGEPVRLRFVLKNASLYAFWTEE